MQSALSTRPIPSGALRPSTGQKTATARVPTTVKKDRLRGSKNPPCASPEKVKPLSDPGHYSTHQSANRKNNLCREGNHEPDGTLARVSDVTLCINGTPHDKHKAKYRRDSRVYVQGKEPNRWKENY